MFKFYVFSYGQTSRFLQLQILEQHNSMQVIKHKLLYFLSD